MRKSKNAENGRRKATIASEYTHKNILICFFVFIDQNSQQRLEKIITLEDEFLSNIKNLTKFKEQDDEKETKKILEYCQNCENKSETGIKKLKQINKSFKNLVSDIRLFLFPDESKWQKWTAADFRKYV